MAQKWIARQGQRNDTLGAGKEKHSFEKAKARLGNAKIRTAKAKKGEAG